MKYLITGGAGFIGSHLVEELLARGDQVVVIDDLSTGSRRNLSKVEGHHNLRVVVDSCANATLMEALVGECDQIFHLAAAVGVKLIIDSPVRTIETNVQLTEILLRLAARKKRPVLVASTSEVYGKSERLPYREDGDLVLGPTTKGRWSYACSKAIDEFLALAYWKEQRLPTVVVRLFNTVGPRQTGRYGMVIPGLVRQGLAGQPITVYGDGKQTRCFAHVADVVRALMGVMESERAYGGVFNIGSSAEISILELAKRIREMTGGRSDIVLVPYSEAYEDGFEDMRRRVPDVSKIEALIGWSARASLTRILADVIDHQRGVAAEHHASLAAAGALQSAP
jgi:UDP-glucose 4-epimerase